MSEPTVGPIQGAGEVRPLLPGELGALGPATANRPPATATPGVDVFDRLELNSGRNAVAAYAKFTVHPETGVVSIKILDARTDEVIREIPPDEVLRIAEELQAYLALRRRGS